MGGRWRPVAGVLGWRRAQAWPLPNRPPITTSIHPTPQVIDLGDGMTFEVLPPGASGDELACDAPGVPTDGTNLALRALDLFRAKTGDERHYRVTLDKRVPHGEQDGGGR